MPRMNGLETLTKLKEDLLLTVIPTVLVSTSSNAAVIESAKQLGATRYFIKPASIEGLLELARKIIYEIPWANL